MQKENSLFCLVLGLVPNKSLNRIFASYDLCNLLGYGTNRARWECVSLSTEIQMAGWIFFTRISGIFPIFPNL